MQRVPGLRCHRQKILAGRKIAEVVCAGVVGSGFGLLGDSGAGVMAAGFEEEQDLGVFHRVAAVAATTPCSEATGVMRKMRSSVCWPSPVTMAVL
jgi:hypothetical protein